jgi:rhomboid family GlyGly-CTERM serine protease
LGFAVLLAICSGPALFGAMPQNLIFQPDAVRAGEWWRLLTHPFVHVTWYHLLLDGSAFFLLYHSLLETRLRHRLAYVLAAGTGSLLLSWLAAPAIAAHGLCGLSGIAHGLMAISALEMMRHNYHHSAEWRWGAITFALVVGKALFEAVTGRVFFGFLHFGLMGAPVAVSHAGGILGGLLAALAGSQTQRRTKAG